MTPPTTIIASPIPALPSALFSAGTSARWPAASDETPTIWTLLVGRQRRDLLGRREQRPDLDVEAEIGESRGDDLLAAIVAVLAHLGDEDARTMALVLGEGAGHRHHALVGFRRAVPLSAR